MTYNIFSIDTYRGKTLGSKTYIPRSLNASVCVCTRNISTDWTRTNISPLKFLARLLSWVKSSQHSEKSTLIHKTQPRCFHCGCSVFCASVHFISSPRPSCQSIPSGTAGTPPLWTKTRAPWPSWRVAPGDLWTACPCCSSGSMWNAKSKSWPHLNMWKVARSNRKYTVNRRKTIKQSINLRRIILFWNSTQINSQYG